MDITAQVTDLNLKLQGKNSTLNCMMKLRLWMLQLSNENLIHFPIGKELKNIANNTSVLGLWMLQLFNENLTHFPIGKEVKNIVNNTSVLGLWMIQLSNENLIHFPMCKEWKNIANPESVLSVAENDSPGIVIRGIS